MSILGKFAVIMADPPWDIHMELPYGKNLKGQHHAKLYLKALVRAMMGVPNPSNL